MCNRRGGFLPFVLYFVKKLLTRRWKWRIIDQKEEIYGMGETMGFIRRFDDFRIERMKNGRNAETYARLLADVLAGEVFPSVRKDEIDFYYRGGCLYRFDGNKFVRDPRYRRYSLEETFSDEYERAKAENERKFLSHDGGETERRLLDRLYCHTFSGKVRSEVVVLDIEVNLGGRAVRKCDLVLLITRTDALMFVEGKVFSDRRVRCAVGHTPEVIGQVNFYSSAIAAQRESIVEAYGEHVKIVNKLFKTSYIPPKRLIEPAKLLVYFKAGGREENIRYSVETIEESLGRENVMWTAEDAELSEIWNALAR